MERSKNRLAWLLLLQLWAILAITMGCSVFGPGVIASYMAPALHLDRAALGTASAVFQWMSGLPAPLVAILVNKRGPRFALMLGLALLALGSLGIALLVRNPIGYILTYGLVIGFAAVVAGPLPAQAVIARWFLERRASAMSLLLTAPAVGGFAASQVLSRVIVSQRGNWRAGWVSITGLAVCALAVAAFVKSAPGAAHAGEVSGAQQPGVTGPGGPPGAPDIKTLKGVLRTSTFWLVVIAQVGLFAGFMLFATHGVLHLRDLGFTQEQAASSFSIVFLSILCGNLLFAAIGDRFDARYLLCAASLLFAVGFMLAVKPAGTVGLYTYPIFVGLGYGIGVPTMAVLPLTYFGERTYVSIAGLMLALSTVYGSIDAFGGGYSFDHFGSYRPAFLIVIGLSLMGAVVALFVRRPTHSVGVAVA